VTHPAWGVLIAYALGSIPFAFLAGRVRGVDLRLHGSGNLGAANATRVLGPKLGGLVYVFDTLKGFAAAFLLPRALGIEPGSAWPIAYGVAAVAGHIRPIFLGFRRGGKGVATAGGVFLGLAPAATLVSLGVFIAVLLTTGYASVGSLAAAVTLPIALLLLHRDAPLMLNVVAVGVATFLFWSHRSNLGRLRRGEEPRFDLTRRARGGGSAGQRG
jgi:acyl phosphate:glycerol-3-phosphate acyltransferase